jgi:hypothetical protein
MTSNEMWQDVLRMVREVFDLYTQHFKELVVICLLFASVLGVVDAFLSLPILSGTVENFSVAISILLSFVITSILSAIMTIVVLDLYSGKPSDFYRAVDVIKKIGVGRILPSLVMYQFLTALGGMMMIIPGVIFFAMTIIFVPVLILEGEFGWPAVKRCINLGRDYHVRNFCVFIIVGIPQFGLMFISILTNNYITETEVLSGSLFFGLMTIFSNHLFISLASPLLHIAPVLLFVALRGQEAAAADATNDEDATLE